MKALMLTLSMAATAAAQYNYTSALRSAYYNKMSYCDDTVSVVDMTCAACQHRPNAKDIQVINSTFDTRVLVGYDEGDIFVTFRGSHNLLNWIADLDAADIEYNNANCSGCRVHQGFYDAFNDIAPKLSASLKVLTAKYGQQQVIVTGHSLGAALSLHALIYLQQNGFVVKTLYNFGSPRVGNPAFAKFAGAAAEKVAVQPAVRVTHYRDPVPHLPLLSMGFAHAIHEVFYSDETGLKYVECTDSPADEDDNCSDQFWFAVYPSDHLHYLDMPTHCEDTDDLAAANVEAWPRSMPHGP